MLDATCCNADLVAYMQIAAAHTILLLALLIARLGYADARVLQQQPAADFIAYDLADCNTQRSGDTGGTLCNHGDLSTTLLMCTLLATNFLPAACCLTEQA